MDSCMSRLKMSSQEVESIIASIDKRILALEISHGQGRGNEPGEELGQELGASMGGGGPILDQVESVLNFVNDIQNIEVNFKVYATKLGDIYEMCTVANPNWPEVFMAILDLIAEEELVKKDKNEKTVRVLQANLEVLELMDTVARKTSAERYPWRLQSHVDSEYLGVIAVIQTVSGAISDVKSLLRTIRDYAQTVESITSKFTKIKTELQGLRWDGDIYQIGSSIFHVVIEIVSILRDEDTQKNDRENEIITAAAETTIALKQTVLSIDRLKLVDNLSGDLGIQLGGLFESVTGIFDTVIKGINMIANYQKTIQQISEKYSLILSQLEKFPQMKDIREVVPCLLETIQIIKAEDTDKIKRDMQLVQSMQLQNNKIAEIYNLLIQNGFVVVEDKDGHKNYFCSQFKPHTRHLTLNAALATPNLPRDAMTHRTTRKKSATVVPHRGSTP